MASTFGNNLKLNLGLIIRHNSCKKLDVCRPKFRSTNNQYSFKFLHTSGIQNGLRTKSRAPTLAQLKRRVDYLKEKGLYPVTIRSQFLEWNYDAELYSFGRRLKEEFDDQLLREAFTDDSYIFHETKRLTELGVENPGSNLKNNKDLADAGVALIENFALKYLRAACPVLPEEAIEAFVDYLTSEELLSKIGKEFGVRDLILTHEYPPKDATYARCIAALVGCVNASSGIEKCHAFIRDFVVVQLVGKDLWDIWEIDDPISTLKDILVRSGRGEPEPRLMGDLGKNTIESVFQVGIYDGNKNFVGKGFGETVDVAIQVAALDCLSKFFEQTTARSPLPFDSLPLKSEPNTSIRNWKLGEFNV